MEENKNTIEEEQADILTNKLLDKSAQLYAEIYEEDKGLQEWTDSAILDWE